VLLLDVIAGLDPAIQQASKWGRYPIRRLDCRVKSGNDNEKESLLLWPF
jgi:hypothetical protein